MKSLSQSLEDLLQLLHSAALQLACRIAKPNMLVQSANALTIFPKQIYKSYNPVDNVSVNKLKNIDSSR